MKGAEDLRTIKCNIKSILRSDYNYGFLKKIIKRSNDLIFLTSHFIRSFMIYLYDKGIDLPIIDKKLIMSAFKTLSKKSCGPKSKNKILKDMQDYHQNIFIQIINPNYKKGDNIEDYKLSAVNLSYIIAIVGDDMLISY